MQIKAQLLQKKLQTRPYPSQVHQQTSWTTQRPQLSQQSAQTHHQKLKKKKKKTNQQDHTSVVDKRRHGCSCSGVSLPPENPPKRAKKTATSRATTSRPRWAAAAATTECIEQASDLNQRSPYEQGGWKKKKKKKEGRWWVAEEMVGVVLKEGGVIYLPLLFPPKYIELVSPSLSPLVCACVHVHVLTRLLSFFPFFFLPHACIFGRLRGRDLLLFYFFLASTEGCKYSTSLQLLFYQFATLLKSICLLFYTIFSVINLYK